MMQAAAHRHRFLVLAAFVLAAGAPSAAAAEPLASRTLIEGSLGLLVPAVSWDVGTPETSPYGSSPIALSTIQDLGFIGGVRFGYLFGLGDGPSCCLLGPEIGISWIVWDPEDPGNHTSSYGYSDLQGLRLVVPVALRVMGIWDWGWVLGRLGAGPDLVMADWGEFGSHDGDTGVLFLAGTGVGVAVSEWIGITLLVSAMVPYHEHAGDESDEDLFWGFGSFQMSFELGLTFLL